MPRFTSILLPLFASAVLGSIEFCSDESCNDCPVGIRGQGVGFPECVVYNTDDFFKFGDHNFTTTPSGGWEVRTHNEDAPDQGCRWIIRSPAGVDMENCGIPTSIITKPNCGSAINLDSTFMLQFCCGSGDCRAAGASARDGQSGGMYLTRRDGSIIEPLATGPPPNARTRRDTPAERRSASNVPASIARTEKARRELGITPERDILSRNAPTTPSTNELARRVVVKGKSKECKENTWKPDPNMESYTKLAGASQILFPGVNGPQTITDSFQITSGWSVSVGFDMGFADIFSIGLSFEHTNSEETSNTVTREFEVPAGVIANIVFTPWLICSTGSVDCKGIKHGEVCAPLTDSNDNPTGSYNIVPIN